MNPFHFALLGGELHYSCSPRIFQAIFQWLGCEGTFDLCSAKREQLQVVVRDMIDKGVEGFSVTIPHKQSIIKHLDSVDDLAQKVGAVNSVAVKGGRLLGYNTDGHGAAVALRKGGFSGCEWALILGAGGAARAVVHMLMVDFGIRNFVLFGRTEERQIELEYFVKQERQGAVVQSVQYGSNELQHSLGNLLVVNCTPLGGPLFSEASPIPPWLKWQSVKFFFDLNYNAGNQTVKAARDAGVKATDGSVMLVAQALKSMELWTGTQVPFEYVYELTFPR